MKKICYIPFVIIFVGLMSCSKMYDNLEKYAGEIVYPGKFDTIVGHIGYERLEIDLMKAGRLPASEIKLGKATKTIIEYDGKTIIIDTLASWINIDSLTESKLYRIRVYTMDDEGNKSVPQEIALIPFTEGDKSNLTVQPPKITATPDAAALTWPGGISSVLLDYYSLKYTYKDKDGTIHNGEAGNNPIIVMQNLEAGSSNSIDISFKIIPKVNGVPMLDTIWLDQEVIVNVPQTIDPYFGKEQSLGAVVSVSKENDGGAASREGSSKLIDFDFQTKFYVGGYTSDFWMRQDLFMPLVVNSYLLSSGNDAPGRDPKSWTLQGSNDGEHWTTIDTRSNETFDQRNTPRVFDFANPIAYRHYRLLITANNGSGSFQLGEWRLFLK